MKEAEELFRTHNLLLVAEYYNVDMAQAQVVQAKLFDNPIITLEQNIYNRLNGKYFDLGKEGESGVQIEQAINLAGQRNKRIRLEKINHQSALLQFEEVARTLNSELKETCVEMYFLTKSVQIYDKEITSLEELLLFYKNMAEKGNISLLELSRMQALLLSLKKEKNDAVNELVSKRGNLKMLLNLPVAQEIEILLDETMLSRLDLSSLSLADLDSLLPSRPDQRLAFSILEASKANLKLQRSLSAPEFAIQGIYDRAGNFINNYFAVGLSFSVPIFNRNQGNIKSAKLEIEKSLKEKEYTENKANSELYVAYSRLEKAMELYQSADDDLEKNFNRLLEGVNENFRKRNISMLEFVDYYESYKETSLQLYETRKDVFLVMENLNTVVGRNIFNY
jgi:cobalt-zinc-cadmium efflux system outer membrane protein